MSEINSTIHKKNIARLFPDEGFREAVCKMVESKRHSSQRYMICVTLFARSKSQKTHCYAHEKTQCCARRATCEKI